MSEALCLADDLEAWTLGKPTRHREAAAELRRLHELNVDKTEIIASLSAMNQELLRVLKSCRNMVGHPDNLALIDAAIAKVEVCA